MRQQAVVGVALRDLGPHMGGLAVGGAHDDGLLNRLHVPAGAHKFGRQPVQQLRMARIFGPHAEVLTRRDDADAEELLPEPIDEDARRERVVGACDPLRQSEAVVGVACRHRAERGGQARRHGFAGMIVLAANQDIAGARLGHLVHYHDGRDLFVQLRPFGFSGITLRRERSIFRIEFQRPGPRDRLPLRFGALRRRDLQQRDRGVCGSRVSRLLRESAHVQTV